MISLLTDTPLRKMLAEKGLERSATFSWEKCAPKQSKCISPHPLQLRATLRGKHFSAAKGLKYSFLFLLVIQLRWSKAMKSVRWSSPASTKPTISHSCIGS